MRVTSTCDTINSVVISNAPNIQYYPDVAFGGGNYLVVWSDGRMAPFYQIFGARVTPGGSVLEPSGILIGPNNTLFQYYPSVAFGGTRFLVIWTYGTSPYQIMGRFVNTNGTMGDTIVAAVPGGYTMATRLASDGTNFFVAWLEYTGSEYAVKGVVLDGSGAPVCAPFVIASGVNYSSLGLVYDGYNFLVTYSALYGSVYQICGKFFSSSGVPIDTVFRISNSAYNCYYGDVYPGANDRCLNVWAESRTTYDIYGNIDVEIGIQEETGGSSRPVAPVSTIITGAIELRDIAGGTEAEVYDASGSLIGLTRNGVFDCSSMTAGVYFVRVKTASDQYDVIKVIKVR